MLALVHPAQRVTISPTQMHTYASSVHLATLLKAKDNYLARVSVLCSLLQDILQKMMLLTSRSYFMTGQCLPTEH